LGDVRAAKEWARTQPSVDPQRLAVVGNSFGGYLALAGSAADLRIQATVSITPLVDPSTVSLPDELFEEFALMLNSVTATELTAQWDALPAILTKKDDLDARSMLLITADRDEIFPVVHYEPLVAEIDGLSWVRIADADHVFSTSRKHLVRTIVDWLLETVGN